MTCAGNRAQIENRPLFAHHLPPSLIHFNEDDDAVKECARETN
jgi:hypothetical protein